MPGRAVQRQSWHHLLFLHWPVPAELVRPLLPPALPLDTFAGQAWIGLVPFTMTGVRPVWLPPIPFLSRFHEVNVRTYTNHAGVPGVWFFSLDAASTLAVLGARWLWGLPYHRARMRLDRAADGRIAYRSERRWPRPLPGSLRLTYHPGDATRAAPAVAGTLEHFLVERYVLHVLDRKGGLRSGRVVHEPYRIRPAEVKDLDESLLAANGIARPPVAPLAHYCEGVDVRILGLERC